MKAIQFDKIVSLLIDKEDDKTQVIVNGVQFIYINWILNEEVDTLTVKEAKAIEAKYTKQEDGQFSKEDIEAIQEEVATYKTLKPIILMIWEMSATDAVESLLLKMR